jgi:acyl-coenzyme A synthetase/AMP-(fatty) acid ligase
MVMPDRPTAHDAGFPTIDVRGGLPRTFDEAVTRAPGRTAIETATRAMTMSDLAESLAVLDLRLRGVPSGTVLATPRDPVALAVTVIAAARAGRACVLADPERPASVLRQLAARVGATVIVTDVSPTLEAIPIASSGEDGADPKRAGGATRDGRGDRVETGLGDAAVWIPTSGTTGEPSLVGITEQALLAMAVEAVGLGIVVPGDRVARLATHLGIGPLLSALILGLPYVAIDVRRTVPSGLSAFLDRHEVTYLHLAPTLLRTLLGDPRRSRPSHPMRALRLVGSGGEVLRWADITLLRRALGLDVDVLHTYSSTEAGMVTARFIRPDEDGTADASSGRSASRVPVGRPLPGRDVWIDAGDGSQASPGTIGEIVVEGRFGTLSRRATGLPDGRQRLHTGDLGALRIDGELELAGRVGRDGKVGLWRVDLAEVEAAIAVLDGVIDVVVSHEGPGPEGAGSDGPEGSATDHDATAARTLVAHVLLDRRIDISDERIRAAVGGLSPAAVPRRIVRHDDRLPTSTSGKVDASRLTD